MKISEFRKLIREEVRKVLKEENAPLEPNATYKATIELGRGYSADQVEKVTGYPLQVAQEIKAEAEDRNLDMDNDDEDSEEYVAAYELDKFTYLISTDEETAIIVGSPRSEKYGKFWSDPASKESEDLYYQMENDIAHAREI